MIEPASEMIVPTAEKIVMARNMLSMEEITSHVSTDERKEKKNISKVSNLVATVAIL